MKKQQLKIRVMQLEETLRRLDQWFDTDPETIEAMSSDELIAHNRAHAWIRDALRPSPR